MRRCPGGEPGKLRQLVGMAWRRRASVSADGPSIRSDVDVDGEGLSPFSFAGACGASVLATLCAPKHSNKNRSSPHICIPIHRARAQKQKPKK